MTYLPILFYVRVGTIKVCIVFKTRMKSHKLGKNWFRVYSDSYQSRHKRAESPRAQQEIEAEVYLTSPKKKAKENKFCSAGLDYRLSKFETKRTQCPSFVLQ